MEVYITAIKDILVVVAPIIVAFLSYKSSKKTERDIRMEIEKSLKEKDAETAQMLAKINAELESQKMLTSWQNSLPQTEKYVEHIGIIRNSNVSSIPDLTRKISVYIEQPNIPIDELKEIHSMLLKVKIPMDKAELYPYEIPIIIDYRKMLKNLEKKIKEASNMQ